MAEQCEKSAKLSGDIKVDEAYFGPSRVRGKRGRRAGEKTVVFGIFKQRISLHRDRTRPMKATLQAIIRGKVDPDSVYIRTVGVAMTVW